MAKAFVIDYVDADPGADDNNVVLLAKVLFVGATVPNSPLIDQGPAGNGIAIPWNIIGTAAAFSNNVESAIAARATQLGFTLAATDVFFPSFTRGT
jgi:hypothetical protein